MSNVLMVIAGLIAFCAVWKYCKAFKKVVLNREDTGAKNYFLGRAYRDMVSVFLESFKKESGGTKKTSPSDEWWVGCLLATFVWPIWVTVFLVFGAIHIAIVLTCSIVVFTLCWVTWAVDAGYRWRNGIFTVCPNPGCHCKSKLPAYRCNNPECKEIYNDLYPSPYGIWRRKCKCKAKIPTTFFNGRNKLEPYCPRCGEKQVKLKKSRPIEIPIVGAPSVGKTYFLHSMICHIKKAFAAGDYEFVDGEEKEVDSFIEKINAGETPGKQEYDPKPLRFYLTKGGGRSLLHLYDPAGEAFSGSKDLKRQTFYNHFDGLVFVIDPFSIPEVRLKYESQLAEAGIKPGPTPAEDVLESLMMNFEKNCGVKATGRIMNPVAVVFSKTGVLDLPKVFMHGASADETNEACRQFLRDNGGGSLLKKIEWRFANVRYFAVDSKGNDSVGVGGAVDWLLGKIDKRNAAIKLANTVGVAAAALAAACVIASAVFFTVRVASPGVRSTAAWAYRVSTGTRWYAANIEASDYTVSTAEELAGLARIVNGNWRLMQGPKSDNFAGKTITLAGDVDLSAYENWVPIGNSAAGGDCVFSGTFNGNGHVIRGLKIDRPDADYQGLFGVVVGGRVENLWLDGVDVRGRDRVGGVAASVSGGGRIVDSRVTGRVYGRSVVGGLAGVVAGGGRVSGGYSGAAVSGGSNVGGVAGQLISNGDAVSCRSDGAVSGGNAVGGVAGIVRDKSGVANCYSAAAVDGKDEVGGVAGTVRVNSYVSGSYSVGEVGGVKGVGGVAGSIRVDSRVEGSAALNPAVKGSGADVGRVVGISFKKSKLSNNAAFSEMKNISGSTAWGAKGLSNAGGADVSAAAVRRDGTVGGRFTAANGWAVQEDRLPGYAEPAAMPPHLAGDGRP